MKRAGRPSDEQSRRQAPRSKKLSLAAIGKRFRANRSALIQSKVEPLEELVLELTGLKLHEEGDTRRASARARLIYEPATRGQREVASERSWPFIAPIGPIETDELHWYLEKYAVWPGEYFRDRARKVEESLVQWGRLLHEAALPVVHTANVMQAWARIDDHAGRRFSVKVDRTPDAGDPATEEIAAREAATLLLGLPWELLHDGRSFLFQGAMPVRVRRRLPNTRVFGVSSVAVPIRILLITARPEDDACGYFDHRASALPLVEAVESLGGLVQLQVLDPPTFPALRKELDRARRAREPYHVVHFDGHGIYDRRSGLGGLCFEEPRDTGRLDERRHVTIYTDDLGPLLQDHRIPLVFLEACQTSKAEQASESVASELLKAGVASVVAMSHSVLVETSRRFVEAFYDALAQGARVGDAMLDGQRTLKDDTYRGVRFGLGELRLDDWFVPVLFQEKEDPQLFHTRPSPQTMEDQKSALGKRLGGLPPEPETSFIGRSRELLALQRLLRKAGKGRYAVIRGQGGEGKTALATEFARWMVRSQQIQCAAFVSVETHSSANAVLDAIGRQLVPGYSVATFEELEQAILPVEGALAGQSTLLVVDNMESILLPPYLEIPEALSEEARHELEAILGLCSRLNAKGDTRVIFTSREALPSPFDAGRNRRELHRLDHEDAVRLVERALNREIGGAGAAAGADRESIDKLIDAVHGHARTLALLGPSLRSRGVDATRESLVELMAAMQRKFPGNREQSLFASIELSLRRMTPANRERARVLGMFHGVVDLDVLRAMTGWEESDVESLAGELIETGLAMSDPYSHVTLNPALCPYLRGELDPETRESLAVEWNDVMCAYTDYLVQQRGKDVQIAVSLTLLELPNLFALLEQAQRASETEATIDIATSLFRLLQNAGKPRLLERVAQVRDACEVALGENWSHARFQIAQTRITEQLDGRRVRESLQGARQLLHRAREAGDSAYPYADYDLAVACLVLARVTNTVDQSEEALLLVEEAQKRFDAVNRKQPSPQAEHMINASFFERGNCLRRLGRLDEAAAAYEECAGHAEQLGNERGVAVAKAQLGTVRYLQHRYEEALAAGEETRARFMRLEEPVNVAASWQQSGMVHQEAGQLEAAEDAYRRSLEIHVVQKNVGGQASTLAQLGRLYVHMPGRAEEALAFFRQAADKYERLGDTAMEGVVRINLGSALLHLRRLDEARQEILRAIECNSRFEDAPERWSVWAVLASIEANAGNTTASAEAKQKAVADYLAYRREGGENHFVDGRICLDVTRALLAGDSAAATALLTQLADDPKASWLLTFIKALQAIAAGSRDRTLADNPELDFTMAAEVLFLIETLEKAGN